jgi:hypothetical protein
MPSEWGLGADTDGAGGSAGGAALMELATEPVASRGRSGGRAPVTPSPAGFSVRCCCAVDAGVRSVATGIPTLSSKPTVTTRR